MAKIVQVYTCPNCRELVTVYDDGRETGHLSWCSFGGGQPPAPGR